MKFWHYVTKPKGYWQTWMLLTKRQADAFRARGYKVECRRPPWEIE